MKFFATLEFMNDLGLSLRERDCLAIIYSFSQDNEGCWYGSIPTMSRWLCCTDMTTYSTLKKLGELGFITKKNFTDEAGRMRCAYKVTSRIIGIPSKNYRDTPQNFIGDTPQKIIGYNKDIYINKNNINNIYPFYENLVALGVSESTANDWKEIRKARKAIDNERAFQIIAEEIGKTGATPEDCIRVAVKAQWRGFQAEWYRHESTPSPTPSPKTESVMENLRRVAKECGLKDLEI